MVAGLPSSMKVELEWTPGTWTDVTPWVASEDEGMAGVFGRATEFDDCSAATWTLTLRNDDGRFTPDNPLSPYWPSVDEDTRLRVTAFRGATAYPRFIGYITSIQPSFPDADSTSSVVKIQAADLISALTRRTTVTGYAEQATYIARYNGQANDLFVFPPDAGTATYFQNTGNVVAGVTPGRASILTPSNSVGSWSVESPDSSSLVLNGQLSLTPSGITGPVLKIVTGASPGQLDFFLKVPSTTVIPPNGTALTVVDFWTETADLFSIRLYSDLSLTGNPTHLGIYNGAGAWQGGMTSSSVYNLAKINDDQWHKITVIDAAAPGGLGGVGIWTNIDDSIWNINWTSTGALTTATRLVFGGAYGGPARESKTTLCPAISLAGINIEQANSGVFGYFALGTPPATTAGVRFTELLGYAGPLVPQKKATLTFTSGSTTVTSATPFFTTDDAGRSLQSTSSTRQWPLGAYVQTYVSPTQATLSAPATASGTKATVISGKATGSADRAVVRVNTLDSGNLAEAFANLARTIGGVFWVNPSGNPELIFPDRMRSKTPIATVDIEADVDGPSVELTRSVDQSPTQVTINTPTGPVVVTSPAALAQSRRDLTVDTGAVNDAAAAAIAGYYLTVSQTLRINQLAVSLATAQNDLYGPLLGSLAPGSRLRIAGLPTAVFGRTWADVYVQGWTEEWTKDDATFTFDLTPADDPVEGLVSDAEYGRVAADGSLSLAFPLTASATSLAVAHAPNAKPSGQLTTTAADYPLDLDVSGERVTCPTVPTSGSRTNLVTNPSFETNITGWTEAVAGFTAGALANAAVTADLYGFAPLMGTRVAQVAWPTVAAGGACLAYTASGLTSGQTYTFSIYVWVPPGAPIVKIAVVSGTASGVTYPTRNDGSSMQDTGTTKGAWVRLAMTVTMGATSLNFGVINGEAWTNGQIFYADAALLEAGVNLGSYFDGGNGGSWTGTANASTSSIPTQTFTGVTRGVAPSVARAHLGGELVGVWHEAQAAF